MSKTGVQEQELNLFGFFKLLLSFFVRLSSNLIMKRLSKNNIGRVFAVEKESKRFADRATALVITPLARHYAFDL